MWSFQCQKTQSKTTMMTSKSRDTKSCMTAFSAKKSQGKSLIAKTNQCQRLLGGKEQFFQTNIRVPRVSSFHLASSHPVWNQSCLVKKFIRHSQSPSGSSSLYDDDSCCPIYKSEPM